LNTVCDIYFCGALDEMVEKWQVQPDVAGATFMAAGGSAPELFTSLIGAVITENDVGFGTIVGSAVFNVLAVIGCCGMAAQEPIGLSWWPLFRDCTFYIIGLLVLAIFAYGESIQLPDTMNVDGTIEEGKRIGGGKIELWEAIVLFVLYLVYCTIMVFNEKLYAWLQGKIDARKGVAPADASKVAPEPIGESADAKTAELKDAAQAEPAPGPPEHMAGASGGAEVAAAAAAAAPTAPADAAAAPADGDGKPKLEKAKTQDHSLDHHLRRVHHKAHMAHHHEHPICMRSKSGVVDSVVKVNTALTPVAEEGGAEAPAGESDKAPLADGAAPAPAGDAPAADAPKEEEEGSDMSEDDILAMVTCPEDTKEKVLWILSCPIYYGLYFTVPRPGPSTFLATFVISLLWIAGYSFWLVYCIEMFGKTIFGEGDNVVIVMSFTILAAGTSIPDLVSSMAVAKAGEGDMAVSSSIGSNIFDILVGLPIPWILKIGVVEMAVNGNSDYAVLIKSPYIALYVFLLLFMVAMVILSIHFNGWFLNKALGVGMAALYLIFLFIVLPVEIVNSGPYF